MQFFPCFSLAESLFALISNHRLHPLSITPFNPLRHTVSPVMLKLGILINQSIIFFRCSEYITANSDRDSQVLAEMTSDVQAYVDALHGGTTNFAGIYAFSVSYVGMTIVGQTTVSGTMWKLCKFVWWWAIQGYWLTIFYNHIFSHVISSEITYKLYLFSQVYYTSNLGVPGSWV